MTAFAPQPPRRPLALLAVAGALLGLLLTPAAASTRPKPQTVSLRLASINQTTHLVAPGLAMSRATRTLVPGQSLTFISEQLRRPLTIDSRPFVRLHLSHSVPGDVTLYVSLDVIGSEGVRSLLAPTAMTAPEAVLSKGAAADVDARMPHIAGRMAPDEQLRLTISELGSTPVGTMHPDVLTVYLGALPGEDTDPHDTVQVLDESKGGKDPARISIRVTGEGPFQKW